MATANFTKRLRFDPLAIDVYLKSVSQVQEGNPITLTPYEYRKYKGLATNAIRDVAGLGLAHEPVDPDHPIVKDDYAGSSVHTARDPMRTGLKGRFGDWKDRNHRDIVDLSLLGGFVAAFVAGISIVATTTSHDESVSHPISPNTSTSSPICETPSYAYDTKAQSGSPNMVVAVCTTPANASPTAIKLPSSTHIVMPHMSPLSSAPVTALTTPAGN